MNQIDKNALKMTLKENLTIGLEFHDSECPDDREACVALRFDGELLSEFPINDIVSFIVKNQKGD